MKCKISLASFLSIKNKFLHVNKRKKQDTDLLNFDEQQLNESFESESGPTTKRTSFNEIIKKIINEDLVVQPFQEARIERARETVRKRKQYYRSKMSMSVKSPKVPWPNLKQKNDYHVSMYNPAEIQRRY